MDSPPTLSGETLIVHHIPLVHCQVPGRQCCGSVKRASPFCQPDLGLTRTTSLPERDVLHREALVYSSLIQTSSGGGGGRGGSSLVSDSSSFTSSNNSEEPPLPPRPKSRDTTAKANPQRHNPFLLNAEEDEEDDEDCVHKTWCTVTGRPGIAEGQEGGRTVHNAGALKTATRLAGCLDLSGFECQRRHGSSGSTLSMDCGEQEWIGSPTEEEEEDPLRNGRRSRICSCCSSSDFPLPPGPAHRCCCYSFSDPSENTDHQMGYVSDSSCNSSDGVLVNFSAIYNKMNNGGPAKPLNLNSGDQSCTSSVCSHPEAGGAFYLDLHTSPTEPRGGTSTSQDGNTCSCQSPQALDANCNSYHLHCEGGPCLSETSDLTSCFQSQARLVVATQNYYKLVTCDISSQSSPSPAGSSITSCSEEHVKSSPTQPTEYYLFRKPEDQEESNEPAEEEAQQEEETELCLESRNVIEGQVYINVSPPLGGSEGNVVGRPRSRSYDRNLDKSPPPRLGSLERMLSCPVRLSDTALRISPPPRVTSFAEMARSKRKSGSLGGGTPPLKTSSDSSSQDFSPVPELRHFGESHSLPPMPFTRCYSQGSCDVTPHSSSPDPQPLRDSPGASRETRSKAEGALDELLPVSVGERGKAGLETILLLKPNKTVNRLGRALRFTYSGLDCLRRHRVCSDGRPVVRYSKDQRPTTLPIQPFIFQHQLSKQPKLRPLLSDYVSQMYSRPSGQPAHDRGSTREGEEEGGEREADENRAKKTGPNTVRPSPLGSYSPVRHGAPSSETCSTCTPSPDRGHSAVQPPRSLSCPLSASLLPVRPSPVPCVLPPTDASQAVELSRDCLSKQLQQATPPQALKKEPPSFLPTISGYSLHRNSLPTLPTAGFSPLGHLEPAQRRPEGRLTRRNVFDFPVSASHAHARQNGAAAVLCQRNAGGGGGRKHLGISHWAVVRVTYVSNPCVRFSSAGQSVKQLQNYYSDFFPDYFSLTEKPPEEFCLSPDAATESVSIDLLQKKGLVKAINTAVDLIVAHFGTSRDPGVKAKLGNSSVSPNVGHLILKYLCPAMREVLQDGLKAYVLDMIIGQCRNVPWSVVEASTQLGPSTRVLHSLYSKISQYSELTSHRMRFNAFIFGLLNLRSLEFWFNHLYTHEDVVAAHYHPWGFLPLSQGVCQPLFEELLLLLQPLSLLPFDLDLLFEPRLLQKGQEQLRRKEQLCSAGQGLEQSVRSTFQLMRGWGTVPTREGLEPRRDGASSEMNITQRAKGVGGESWWEREEGERERRKERDQPLSEGTRQRDRQAGWWYQLMQSSQVYIDNSAEGSKFVKWEKRKKAAGEAQASRGQDVGRRQAQPPPRVGVVEGAEASQDTEARKGGRGELSAGSKGKPSWMGSPPESVLNELKRSKEKEPETLASGGRRGSQEEGAADGAAQGLRWGRLFGAGVGSPVRTQRAERAQKSRLPSGWLSLDKSVLDLMAQTVGAGKLWDHPPQLQNTPPAREHSPAPHHEAKDSKQLALEVRTLCHHIATEPGHLSFKKGDVLRVLSRAEPDWLYCALGHSSGLVPIIYVTLTEESHGN
ncbi:RUSC2 protein, partial [Amia calva]|nr:RUSC2 protein [Amia calva]